MKLGAMAQAAGLTAGPAGDLSVTGFAIDHRKIAPGTVFGAFRGARFNGEDFIAEAIAHGAIAVVARPEADEDDAPGADAAERRHVERLLELALELDQLGVLEETAAEGAVDSDQPGALLQSFLVNADQDDVHARKRRLARTDLDRRQHRVGQSR